MIGLCTDSNSQIPRQLAARLGIEVVPLAVTIDGRALLEGVDLDADDFWGLVTEGASELSTAAPSPGQFLDAYRALASRDATEILSVHVSAATSSTIEAARLAATAAPCPVTVVDSGTASYGVCMAVEAAAAALGSGADAAEAAQAAAHRGREVRTVFVLAGLDMARRGGRLRPGGATQPGARPRPGVGVYSMRDGAMVELGRPLGLPSAVEVVATVILEAGEQDLTVAIGTSDAPTERWAAELEYRLLVSGHVATLARYRIGPSVGVHTGPGTVGAYWYARV